MAKSTRQKAKLLYLAQMFLEETDEDHGMTIGQIIEYLMRQGISSERKSLYQDFEELRAFGLDVVSQKTGRQTLYYVGSRQFELAELKLLVDAVQSSKFMTAKKTEILIRKLERLTSRFQAVQLERQVYGQKLKNENETIYYGVDTIHAAIQKNVKIRFRYFQWTVKKEAKFRHNGAFYQISPWALLWDNENYYMVAYDSEEKKIKHYRTDKMVNVELTDELREGRDAFEALDISAYTRTVFSMYGGKSASVTLCCENQLAGVLIDRFGRDIPIRKQDEDHFCARVNVEVSRQFYGWLFGLGAGVKILSPDWAAQEMKKQVEQIYVDICQK